MSGSSFGRMRSITSSTVTFAPRREKVCASSRPIGPAPRTASVLGRAFRSKTVSCVWKPAASRPGIGGTTGRAPVAITMRFDRRRPTPSTSIVSGPTKRASPNCTSTPIARKRSGSSWCATVSLAAFTRERTLSSAWVGSRGSRPSRSAERIAWATRDAAISAFDGTQPVQRQSPPSRCLSTKAGFVPR